MPELHSATLGLGGNIGDAAGSIARALTLLDRRDDCDVVAVSRLYRTPPWGKTDQAWFFNACAMLSTTLSPEALLDACLSIEREMKRERLERWGPRTIDIDILLFGGLTIDEPGLQVPHPRMKERAFVLLPLAEIAPELEIGGTRLSELLSAVDSSGVERIADAGDRWWTA